jgi:protein-S-isoprenylcysteine O-methyltransferase Ste14
LIFLSMRKNSFASSTVEIQADQRIIDTGPYAVVRHPMYSGGILMFVATPPALGSWWALAAAIPAIVVIVTRLIQEEKLLARDIPSYGEYCKKIRFRLIPFIW